MSFLFKTKKEFIRYKKIYDKRQYDNKGKPYLIVHSIKEKREIEKNSKLYDEGKKKGILLNIAPIEPTEKKYLTIEENEKYSTDLNNLYEDFLKVVDRERILYWENNKIGIITVLVVILIMVYILS